MIFNTGDYVSIRLISEDGAIFALWQQYDRGWSNIPDTDRPLKVESDKGDQVVWLKQDHYLFSIDRKFLKRFVA